MKRLTKLILPAILMIIGIGCNETKIKLPNNSGDGGREPSAKVYKQRLYQYMDFRDEDGNWIPYKDHKFFIKKKDNQKIVIARKIHVVHKHWRFRSVRSDFKKNPEEWFEDNSIDILDTQYHSTFQYFTLSIENVRISGDKSSPSINNPEINVPSKEKEDENSSNKDIVNVPSKEKEDENSSNKDIVNVPSKEKEDEKILNTDKIFREIIDGIYKNSILKSIVKVEKKYKRSPRIVYSETNKMS